MADTPELLEMLKRSRKTWGHMKTANFPVLVPNMTGLNKLLSLEDRQEDKDARLTNEIAVFVPASDVSGSSRRPLTVGILSSK
jgi:hypothetical protein